MDLDGGSPRFFPVEVLFPRRYMFQLGSFLDSSVYHSKHLFSPGNHAFQETLGCISKFRDTLVLWFASGVNMNANDKLSGDSTDSDLRTGVSSAQADHITCARHGLPGFCSVSRLSGPEIPEFFSKISRFALNQFLGEYRKLQSFPEFSLTGALVTPLGKLSSDELSVPSENHFKQRCMDQSPCAVEHRRGDVSYRNLRCSKHEVEPRTGIEFPTILNTLEESKSKSNAEVLVGTGSRTMKIVKIKSLKVYAFGFYVHPYDVCKKLGPKYASISESEVDKNQDFCMDLLREDINMTVRLVVSCNGIKIKTVREAFEKSLRARLMKTNPNADHDCLKSFGSLFSQDISICAGTTIDFRRTADGHLVTEMEGNQIGAVRSKDLCRAFFDMYIGDFPVSEQAKAEIGRNVVNIMRKC